jgi:undecaprenyl diphosphate synthase
MQSNSVLTNFTVQSGQSVPGRHVAIIMDGNGRRASRQGLTLFAGHRAGVAAVRRTIEHAPSLGINRLTLYAFSSDNWSRPAAEVESIFALMRAYFRMECRRMRGLGVRLQVIGRRDRLPEPLLREIERTEAETAGGRVIEVRIAVDYSSRSAIAKAAADALLIAGHDADDRSTSWLSEDNVRRVLTRILTVVGGDVDLLIRTGGEKRLSDFLLWESAYAEFFFTERMWPDFDETDLEAAMQDFSRRERRFGSVPLQPADTVQQLGELQ